MPTPSISQLRHALDIQEQIAKLESELRSTLSGVESVMGHDVGNGKQAMPEPKARKKKAGMSAEGRERMAAAQRARWAKSKGESVESVSEAEPATKSAKRGKKKRRMSPEARARIVAAQKKRWAAFKKAKN